MSKLRVRWLGRTRYRDSYALQHALCTRSALDWLLLQEHDHVYTLGVRTDPANVLPAASLSGADIERVDRGGDVTYHGPWQLVGYPILTLPGHRGGSLPDTRSHVHTMEQILIDAVADLGGPALGRHAGFPGVWAEADSASPAKVAAIGVRLIGRRSLHGFALNVDPDLAMFENIVPCGIAEYRVTSLQQMGLDASMRDVTEAVIRRANIAWGSADGIDRADVMWQHTPEDLAPFSRGARSAAGGHTSRNERLRQRAGVETTVQLRDRKPDFLRAPVRHNAAVTSLRKELRAANLVTVCEEAGCPNLSECWNEGTATFMINGERCTRACGFCLVDTQKPLAVDPAEADRVADTVAAMGLTHAVITTVARDDLPDGGAAGFVATINAVRRRCPDTTVEVLISDCKGDPDSLDAIFDARPDVLNHNIETVARLQRVARPSAGYARSLAVLARAADAGLVTKSGMVLGLGETAEEIEQCLVDLAAVGVDIVTMGQYLRPTSTHLPIAQYWTPDDFDSFAEMARSAGIRHAESSPFTRSSHHAGSALAALNLTAGVN